MSKKTPPPRPNKNADGQPKQPSANPDGGASAAPQPQGTPGQAPSLVPPGGPAPMHAIGSFAPASGMGQRSDARTQVNFKDLPPMGQAQAEEQAGINPAAPFQMIQQQLQSSMQQPQGGPVPAAFIGPMTPPGLENFPGDMSALMQTMQRGYAPGADAAEHAMAQNAHSMARASMQQSQNEASQSMAQSQQGQMMNALLQHLSLNGQIPQPPQPGDPQKRRQLPNGGATSAPQGAPQLSSSY